MFNNRKFLHGFPKDGQQITFTNPSKWSWFTCVVEDQKLLEVGKQYTVKKTQLNSSSSYVWLEEIECYDPERELPFYNLGCFKWEKPELRAEDLIGFSVYDLGMVNREYGIGIDIDGKEFYPGKPKLNVVIDKNNNEIIEAIYI